jgi:DNA mismatch repair protein MSH5
MIDLQQMCMALNLATERSLVLIDEFSKGTNAVDGAGLACAVFEHLLALHEKAPKTLAATHFHEILENDLLTLPAGANPESLGFAHMDVRIDRSVANVKDQIAYLYTLKQGRSCESYGTICAALNGIDKEIVQRAKCLGEWAAKGEDMVAACALMAEEEQEELFEAERIARRFLEVDLSGDASGLLEEILATEVDMSGV